MRIAVVPARGGSKRIPRKNVRPFCGRPMIAWPIEVARESGLFDHVLVSTDDTEIAEVARESGAEVPFMRPAELADDHTGTTAVIAHAVKWASDQGWPLEAVCCIYPTAPFISPGDLAEGWRLVSGRCDRSFAAVRYAHPPQRGFLRAADGSPQLLEPQHGSTRTQDLPPIYYDSGQFYWATREAWLDEAPFFGPSSRFVELPPWRALDIDRIEDWIMAEKMFAVTLTER